MMILYAQIVIVHSGRGGEDDLSAAIKLFRCLPVGASTAHLADLADGLRRYIEEENPTIMSIRDQIIGLLVTLRDEPRQGFSLSRIMRETQQRILRDESIRLSPYQSFLLNRLLWDEHFDAIFFIFD